MSVETAMIGGQIVKFDAQTWAVTPHVGGSAVSTSNPLAVAVAGYQYTTATHTASTITTTAGTVLAANAARQYALLVNDSDTVLYLSLGGSAAPNQGIRLNASGGSYEMTRGAASIFVGYVTAILGSGTVPSLLLLTEGA